MENTVINQYLNESVSLSTAEETTINCSNIQEITCDATPDLNIGFDSNGLNALSRPGNRKRSYSVSQDEDEINTLLDPINAQEEESEALPLSPLVNENSEEPIEVAKEDFQNDLLEVGQEIDRKKAAITFARIEAQFLKLITRIRDRDSKCIDQEVKSIQKGTHPHLVSRLKDIEARHTQRVRDLNALSKYQLESLEKKKMIAMEQIKRNLVDFKRHERRNWIEQIHLSRREEVDRERNQIIEDEIYYQVPLYNRIQAFQDRDEWRIVCKYGFASASLDSLEDDEIEGDLISLGIRPSSLESTSELLSVITSLAPTTILAPTITPIDSIAAPPAAISQPPIITEALSIRSDVINLPLQPPKVPILTSNPILRPPLLKSVLIREQKLSLGDKCVLFDHDVKYLVKLIQIEDDHVLVIRSDGSKTTLNLDLLVEGSVTLTRKIHGSST